MKRLLAILALAFASYMPVKADSCTIVSWHAEQDGSVTYVYKCTPDGGGPSNYISINDSVWALLALFAITP